MNAKEFANIFVIPVTICLIGIWATFKTTDTQNKNAKEIYEGQYLQSEKHHKESFDREVMSQFFELLEHSNVCQSSKKVYFLIGQATPIHAAKLKDLYIEHCTPKDGVNIENIKLSAENAENNAQIKEINGLIADLKGSGRRIARSRLTSLFKENEKLVGELLASAIKDDFSDYKTTLGVLVVLGSVEGGWEPTKELQSQFELLQNSPNMKDKTFKKSFSIAEKNKKNS